MDLINLIAEFGPWAWVVGGVILLGIELIVPGGVLVWLGLSAVIVGVLSLFLPLGWPVQWLLYGVLAVVSVFLWLQFVRRRGHGETDRPHLNQRAGQLVGQHGVLTDAIENGTGRIALGDSIWRVTGTDMPAGSKVRVTGAKGAVLQVESA
jgi:membrane protein implicated in regulation of membrane protease activity